jgi:hypothetical protein
MLYHNGMFGVGASLSMSLIMVVMVVTPADAWPMVTWLTCMIAVLLVRAVDILVWHPARTASLDGVGCDAQREIARFSAGCLLSGLLWAVFPFIFFPMMSEVDRVAATVVFAGITGGSPAVLAPCLPLAIAFCSALAFPAWVEFLLLPGRLSPACCGSPAVGTRQYCALSG